MNQEQLQVVLDRCESSINALADLMAADDGVAWEFRLFAIMVNIGDAQEKAEKLLQTWKEVYDEE